MRQFILSFILLIFSQASFANYEVQKLVDSYNIAKAEVENEPMTKNEVTQTPYTIQVASYINEKDAISHIEELKVQEKDVHYFPTFIRGQVWFKVCVGKFDTKENAEAYRSKFISRMDEPFATVISLLERPTKKNTVLSNSHQERKSKLYSQTKSVRSPASPSVGKKVDVKVPVFDTKIEGSNPAEVKLISKRDVINPKNNPKIAAYQVSENSHGRYYYSLQIGAYPSEEDVKLEIASLAMKDLAYYETAFVKGQKWFRLFVGKFQSKNDAEVFQKKFHEKMSNSESFIRRKPAS